VAKDHSLLLPVQREATKGPGEVKSELMPYGLNAGIIRLPGANAVPRHRTRAPTSCETLCSLSFNKQTHLPIFANMDAQKAWGMLLC